MTTNDDLGRDLGYGFFRPMMKNDEIFRLRSRAELGEKFVPVRFQRLKQFA